MHSLCTNLTMLHNSNPVSGMQEHCQIGFIQATITKTLHISSIAPFADCSAYVAQSADCAICVVQSADGTANVASDHVPFTDLAARVADCTNLHIRLNTYIVF